MAQLSQASIATEAWVEFFFRGLVFSFFDGAAFSEPHAAFFALGPAGVGDTGDVAAAAADG